VLRKDFTVAFSFSGTEREFVQSVALGVANGLGSREKVFYDQWYDTDLAEFNLLPILQETFLSAQLVVAFLSKNYGAGDWTRLEWQIIQDLRKRDSGNVLLLSMGDCEKVPGMLSSFGYIDIKGNQYSPEVVVGKILDKLEKIEGGNQSHQRTDLVPEMVEGASIEKASPLRYCLDRLWPSLHHALTFQLKCFFEPPESKIFSDYLSHKRARYRTELVSHLYIPLDGKKVSSSFHLMEEGNDPFQRPIGQHIRRILGGAVGGDAISAQIAAMSKRSKAVRNIRKAMVRSRSPLILLGDPGSGKTMTLRTAAHAIVSHEAKRVFPRVVVFLRLGEFHAGSAVGTRDVFRFIEANCDQSIRPYLHDLAESKRLIVFFDGMDEMSREHYIRHSEALSEFANAYQNRIKTLFSCRITDFSQRFRHDRLVLVAFNRKQISEYLRLTKFVFPMSIDGDDWSRRRLVTKLCGDVAGFDTRNPFHLHLVCFYLLKKETWPTTRVDLYEFYHEKSYTLKQEEAGDEEPLPEYRWALAKWAQMAFFITQRNQGTSCHVGELPFEGPVRNEAILVGKKCGILRESLPELKGEPDKIRFEHHRLQEFFTAIYIRDQQPQIGWLSKLDAPRWQETMFNVILMGCESDEILSSLTSAIEDAQKVLDSSELEAHEDRLFRAELERKLADRLDLGCRIARKIPHEATLRPLLVEKLNHSCLYLASKGSPTSQVKALRAAMNIAGIDTLALFDEVLKSRVQWVKDQAFILMAGRQEAVGKDLQSELGFALAKNEYARRLILFWKGAQSSKSSSSYFAVTAATVCLLVSVVLMSFAGAFGAEAFQRYVRNEASNSQVVGQLEKKAAGLAGEIETLEKEVEREDLPEKGDGALAPHGNSNGHETSEVEGELEEKPTEHREELKSLQRQLEYTKERLSDIEIARRVLPVSEKISKDLIFGALLVIALALHFANRAHNIWAVSLVLLILVSLGAVVISLMHDLNVGRAEVVLGFLFLSPFFCVLYGYSQVCIHLLSVLLFCILTGNPRRVGVLWKIIFSLWESYPILWKISKVLG